MPANDLTDIEQRVRDAVATGRVVDLRDNGAPADPGTPHPGREVRAAVLAGLILDAPPGSVGLRLRGARVVGHLNLGGRQVGMPVDLRDCAFTGKVHLAKTSFPELSMRGSVFPHGISGRGLRVDGALNLTDCRFAARLYLKRLRAEIVFLDGAKAHGSQHAAVQLRGAEIAQELYCRRGFEVHGGTVLYGAKIGGQLIMDGAWLENPGDASLTAANLEVEQDVKLRGVRANGQVRIAKAAIGDNLELSGMAVAHPGGIAVDATMIEVGHNVLLDDGFSAIGEVNFFLSCIEGRLEVDGSWLSNPGGTALDASRVDIGQSALFNRMAAEGTLNLGGSQIHGQASINQTTVLNPGGDAVLAPQCTIGQSLWIGRGSLLDGTVNLTNSSIANRFHFTQAKVTRMLAVDLDVDILDDDPDCWPDDSHISGMTYRRLPEDERGWPSTRIRWLRRLEPGYTPQPYTQLVSAYQGIGSSAGMREAIIAREIARRSAHTSRWYRAGSRAWGAVLRWTIGFGYAPWRAIPWMGALYVVAWATFASAPRGSFTSDNGHDVFHPALYALDTILPVMQLGSRDEFTAHGAYTWWQPGFTSVGWFLGLVAAAGIAGVFKRD
ncbi:MAG TPA: hypothetical protein VE172_03925 [Stackebrandtia sp.]|uniref:hypothetical protein n=1 Tax=Stackebrandtia sp. TaxID=2023065 RepID=UPI002D5898EC|nr:hypothetical protein [Stackebrandtia sp.]HZE37938.1 hypothetical protein [Stackebrandtia sp.]